MEKRTIVAIVLIFLIYWVSSQFLWKPPVPELSQNNEYIESEITESNQSISTEQIYTASANANNFISSQEINNNLILENEHLIISFSNLGAVINQITLTDFYKSDKVSPVRLIPENQSIMHLDLQNFTTDLSKTAFNYEFIQINRNPAVNFYILDAETNVKILEKTYVLSGDYNLDFYLNGRNLNPLSSYSLGVNSGINITEDGKAAVKDIKNSFKFISQINMDKPKEVTLNRLSKNEQVFSGKINWAAVRSKYFVIGLIPENKIMTNSVNAGLSQLVSNPHGVYQTPGFTLNVKYNSKMSEISDKYSLYLGPVDYNNLLAYNNGMENITELGTAWLRFLAKIFMFYISWLYSFIPNYGVVIIIFAFTLKVLLTPLTNKSLHSGKKLQKVQPLMKEIQQKYKNDIKKQQEELRKLYKEHNVSPLGGCLPMLLQMPIFFALYPVLRYSIDFRQAHFFAWLTDLSEPDPYWILPILMGVFMFVQQKMMQTNQDTANMDEKQAAMVQSQKMMLYLMPPFMVFIFSSLPSGLVLYWTIFNVFTIIQQYFINKKHNTKEN